MRKLRFRVLRDLSKVTNSVRAEFQAQIRLTPKVHPQLPLFCTVWTRFSLPWLEMIQWGPATKFMIRVVVVWERQERMCCTVLNRMCRVPSSTPLQLRTLCSSVSISKAEPTQDTHLHIGLGWEGRSLGPCDLGGHEIPSTVRHFKDWETEV